MIRNKKVIHKSWVLASNGLLVQGLLLQQNIIFRGNPRTQHSSRTSIETLEEEGLCLITDSKCRKFIVG
jgi:hypothetical protein